MTPAQLFTILKQIPSETELPDTLQIQHLYLHVPDVHAEPSEADKMCHCLVGTVPISEHFVNGTNPVLSTRNIVAGYSYQLSPGQRKWLRDRYDLTPTKTVTIIELAMWPGTDHPRRLIIRSDLHVEEHRRKHVLVQVAITQPGEFFVQSALEDKLIEEQKPVTGFVTHLSDKGVHVQIIGGDSIIAERPKFKVAPDDVLTVRWSADEDSWSVVQKKDDTKKEKAAAKVRKDTLSLDKLLEELG